MSICVVCSASPALSCARCRKVHYCGKVCQKLDWNKHKEICFDRVINMEELVSKFWSAVLEVNSHTRSIGNFYGIENINGRDCWLFEFGKQKNSNVTRKDYWTSNLCITKDGTVKMSEEEFYTYETINSCGYFAVPLAVTLSKLLQGSSRLFCQGERVTHVKLIRGVTNIDYVPQVLCFEGKMPINKPFSKWKVEPFHEPAEHLIVGLWTNQGKVFGVDFCCAQYGTKTQINGYYAHMERLPTLEGIPLKECEETAVMQFMDGGKLKWMSPLGNSSYLTLLCVLDPNTKFQETLAEPRENRTAYSHFQTAFEKCLLV